MDTIFRNEHIVIAIMIALFAMAVNPIIPDSAKSLVNSGYFRALFVILIIVIYDHDPKMSLMLSLAFVSILIKLQGSSSVEQFTQGPDFSIFNQIKRAMKPGNIENFTNSDSPGTDSSESDTSI